MRSKKRIGGRALGVFLAVVLLLGCLPLTAYATAYDPQKDIETLGLRFWEDEQPDIRFYINAASRYELETVTAPTVSSIGGDWTVMSLLRGLYTGADYINYIPSTYFSGYLDRVAAYVDQKNGDLDASKSSEWSKVILALTALGADIESVGNGGYNFIEKLSESFTFAKKQGINGPIWEIIAMNTGGYSFLGTGTEDTNTFGKMIDYILGMELSTAGGWSLSATATTPNADITGMTLQAIAPYYGNETLYAGTGATTSYADFCKAVERGIYTLSDIQQLNGGYGSWGTINSGSIAQVIVALTGLGIDPLATNVGLTNIDKTCSFVKSGSTVDGVWTNNMIDALLTFWAAGTGSSPEVGGFKLSTTGSGSTAVNAMATDQALYALIAYDRFRNREKTLYDMTDMSDGQYRSMTAKSYIVTYILPDGSSYGTYSPYSTVTLTGSASAYATEDGYWNTQADGSGAGYAPGELLVMPEHNIVLYAQEKATQEKVYLNLSTEHIAYISGYDDGMFRPNADISRAEAAMLIYKLIDEPDKEAAYSGSFEDVPEGAWYDQAVSYLQSYGIVTGDGAGHFRPLENITRAEFTAILSKFAALTTDGSLPFSDVETGNWAYATILNAYSKGWISGYTDGTFRPTDNISRAEAVSMTNKLIGREAITSAGAGDKTFYDVTSSHWGWAIILAAANTR